jgi:hypothetical protein
MRHSVISFLINITIVVAILIFILFLGSIILINNGLLEIWRHYFTSSLDTHPLPRGLLLMSLSVGIILGFQYFLERTVQNTKWWKKLLKDINKGFFEEMDYQQMKLRIVGIYQTFYGLLVLLGVLTILISMFYLCLTDKLSLFTVFVGEIIIGMAMLLSSYRMYTMEIHSILKNIHPVLADVNK